MKLKVIAVLLILLLLSVTLVTGVFADPGSEDTTAATETVTEAPETVPTEPQPPVTEAVVTEPVVTEPVVTEPAVTEPVVTEPVVTEPVVTEPVVTEPVVTEPQQTEPVETEAPQTDPDPEPDSFVCSLTVRLEETLADQDMLFTVTGEGLRLQLVIPAGKSSVTVHGLEAGNYTVTEERSWSWRFDTEAEEYALRRSVTLASWQTEATVSFHPTAAETEWLSDCARGDGT